MLSIGTQKSAPQSGSLRDRITTITNTTWAEYISLDLPSKRVSFRNGVITIVSPGRNHELIGDYIRAIIWTYCRKNNFALFTYNQTTLKEEGKEGKEPDVAYCFEIDKDKPDLAVEINLTSEGLVVWGFPRRLCSPWSIDDLTKYQYLKIAEVWLWENNKIRFFVYRESDYLELTTSNSLPDLNSDHVTKIVNSCFGKSVLEVEKFFP